MTAIVGVLNKHAISIAADSAVTLGSGKKVMNSANKLFALSKHHPVAIAVYGNAELIGTPWETIIKEFRNDFSDQSCDNLQGYADAFFQFLEKKNFYCTEFEALLFLKQSIEILYRSIIQFTQQDVQQITDFFEQAEKQIDFLNGFSEDTETFIKKEASQELQNVAQQFIQVGVGFEETRIVDIIVSMFTKSVPLVCSSGIVIAGYGENEIYPSLFHYSIGNVINGHLASMPYQPIVIDKVKNTSSICPFAQTDVMQTILYGIAPQVMNIYMKSLNQTFNKMKVELAKIIAPKDKDLANQVESLDIEPFAQMFAKLSRTAQGKQYTSPFINSVASLEKEDLADFAESLITLTSLKRKVSPDQETVGGPVDVMVISKGDGIIWMKRKHYFKPELNHHFFDNYFNH